MIVSDVQESKSDDSTVVAEPPTSNQLKTKPPKPIPARNRRSKLTEVVFTMLNKKCGKDYNQESLRALAKHISANFFAGVESADTMEEVKLRHYLITQFSELRNQIPQRFKNFTEDDIAASLRLNSVNALHSLLPDPPK